MTLLESSTASAVITALSAASEMINGHYADASRMFAIGWNENSNKVIDALFAADAGGLFENSGEFLSTAERFINSAPSFCDLAEVVGYGIVKHKMIRTGCTTSLSRPGHNHGDAIAFLERSQVIGQIFKDNDLTLVDSYRDKVANQQSLAINEVWSHATYTNDISMEQHKLPRQFKLHATAPMTIHDIENHNDAYVYYLLTIALPLLVRADPSFGGHRRAMLNAVMRTMEQRSTPAIETAAKKLHDKLSRAH